MFYDFLSAENVVGQFDNCLFSLHKPQSIGRTTDQDLKDGKWARMVSPPFLMSLLLSLIVASPAYASTASTSTIFRAPQLKKVPFRG